MRYEDAYPGGDGDRALVLLLNLELWGLPTSNPAHDPANWGFVYQRYQRGILHYDASTRATQGILLGDYLKSIMTGRGLPADLEEAARGSRFYRQYDPARPLHLSRPAELPWTDLTGAFEGEEPPGMFASAAGVAGPEMPLALLGLALAASLLARPRIPN